MRAIIEPAALAGSVRAIPSKSAAHRALICAAFAEAPTFIAIDRLSADIEATLRCLGELGVRYAPQDDGFYVVPLRREALAKRSEPVTLDCGESGSTLRFMLPVACALGVPVAFTGAGRLAERPLSPLYEELVRAGAALSAQGAFPLKARGPLNAQRFCVAGNVSSQYVTGLLLAAPLMGGAAIEVRKPIESAPYIDLTLRIMETFGAHVQAEDTDDSIVYTVSAEGYRSPGNFAIEGDWSNAAFWLCASALSSGEVTVAGLDARSTQGDRAVCAALSLLGASVSSCDGSFSARPGAMQSAIIDCKDIPDLVAPLAAVASCIEGTTTFTGVSRLALKESNRLLTIAAALNALGAEVTPTANRLSVTGRARLDGGCANAANDHRIAMMCAIASIRCANPVIIEDAGAVAKSYPDFFDDFAGLGRRVTLEED